MPTSNWHIMIDNDQRLALIEVLRTITTNDQHPLQDWVGMLDELPTIDKGELYDNGPNTCHRMLHGFCL